jgi:ABC-type bacteriocin/lantibiotic exporter with double-glycine peptidase domain
MGSERESLWIVVAHACGVGILSLALPVAIQSLVNSVAFGSVLQPIVVLTIIVVGCLGLSAGLKLIQTLAAEMLQRRIFVRFSLLIASRVPRLRPDVYRVVNVQETVNRFFDIFLVQKALAFLLLEGIGLVLQAGLGLVLLAFYHPFLLAFGLVLVLFIGIICFVLGKGALETAVEESSAKYAMAAWMEDMARVPRILNSSAGLRQSMERADRMASIWLDARENHFKKVFRQTAGTLVLQVLASGVLLGFGGWLVIRKELSLGQLVAAELIVTSVLYSVSKMGKQFEAFYDVVAGLSKIDGILGLPIEEGDGRALERAEGPWAISLKGVSVHEVGGGRKIEDLTLDIPAGSRILIRGRSGTGKSLFAGLISGSILPDSGQLLVQGQDTRYLKPNELRSQVQLVGELEMIDGTIEENLALGTPGANLKEMESALRAVKLDGIVSGFSKGILSRMSARGAPFTYSQARKLMLARALLAKPSLLILDKNSDWLHGTGSSASDFLNEYFSALGKCTVVVLAELDFATDPTRKVFDMNFVIADGVIHHEH